MYIYIYVYLYVYVNVIHKEKSQESVTPDLLKAGEYCNIPISRFSFVFIFRIPKNPDLPGFWHLEHFALILPDLCCL